MPEDVVRRPSAGTAAASRSTTTAATTAHGRRCTRRARRLKTPSSGAASEPLRISRRAETVHSAGTRVSATSTATRTTETPAAPIALISGAVNDHQPGQRDPDGEAGEEHGAAGGGDGPGGRPADLRTRHLAGRDAGRRAVQLLAEPADHQQAVVDAQAEPEDGDDVDDGGVEVDHVGEHQQDGEAAADGRDRPQDRHAGGDEAAEDEDHHQQADRQGDALADAQVLLHLVVDVADQPGDAADPDARSRHRGQRRRRLALDPVDRAPARSWCPGPAPGSTVTRNPPAVGACPGPDQRRGGRRGRAAGDDERRPHRRDTGRRRSAAAAAPGTPSRRRGRSTRAPATCTSTSGPVLALADRSSRPVLDSPGTLGSPEERRSNSDSPVTPPTAVAKASTTATSHTPMTARERRPTNEPRRCIRVAVGARCLAVRRLTRDSLPAVSTSADDDLFAASRGGTPAGGADLGSASLPAARGADATRGRWRRSAARATCCAPAARCAG